MDERHLRALLGVLVLPVRQISNKVICAQSQADRAAGDPTAIDEPPPAILDVLQVDLADHVTQRQSRASAAAGKEERSSTSGPSGGTEEPNLHHGQAAEDLLRLGVVLEGDALDARLGVVAYVHVCVDHVVEDGPGDIASIEKSCSCQCGTVGKQVHTQRWKAHDGAPRKGEAKDKLRIVGYPLGQGVGCHE